MIKNTQSLNMSKQGLYKLVGSGIQVELQIELKDSRC